MPDDTAQTLYAVGSGEYEQYGIDCVFPTEELAEAAVAMGVGDQVESLMLMNRLPERVPWHEMSGRLDNDGRFVKTARKSLLDGPGIDASRGSSWWDYCVPDPPQVTTDRWAGRRSKHEHDDFAEVRGRDRALCRKLLEDTLRRLESIRQDQESPR